MDTQQEHDMRVKLEEIHGPENVFNTEQAQLEFNIEGFSAPFCYGKRRATGEKVTLRFIHSPRFYWLVK